MTKYTKEEKKAIDLYIWYCEQTTKVIKELGSPNERHTLPSVMEELVKLNLATCTKEKRSPGRPRKEKPVSDAPKRPRGRPRKNH